MQTHGFQSVTQATSALWVSSQFVFSLPAPFVICLALPVCSSPCVQVLCIKFPHFKIPREASSFLVILWPIHQYNFWQSVTPLGVTFKNQSLYIILFTGDLILDFKILDLWKKPKKIRLSPQHLSAWESNVHFNCTQNSFFRIFTPSPFYSFS